MNIHHALWSRRFRTHWLRGSFAYELQIGSFVFQWFYETPPKAARHGRFHIWRDHYTNYPSYRRYALWGHQ